MSSAFFQGPPGITAAVTANFKAIFTHRSESFLSQGRYIDPTKSRDASNTVDVGVLLPGKIMGKITSSGLYAPSIYGLTNGALTATGTTLTAASAAIITEIGRRLGSTTSGSVNLTGPPTAGGVVRTLTATYSALSGTGATITALGVNEVQTLDFANTPSGSFSLNIVDVNGVLQNTGPIVYSGTAATLVSNIQTAINLVIPQVASTNQIVVAGSVVTAITLTFSGTGAGYAAMPQTLVTIGGELGTSGTISVTRTTAGVDGRFVTGSLIQPADGSQSLLSFLPDWDAGIRVTDQTGASISGNVDFPKLPTWGEVDCTQLIDFPTDTSLRTWFQQQLSNATAGKFTFAGTTGVY